MAKQPDDSQKKKAPQQTQLSKKSSEPTQLAKKSSQPTQLAPAEPSGPDTPPRAPKLEIDDVVEAEAADSGVVEAQPASDAVEVQPVSDVVEAEPASNVSESMMVDSGVTKAADDEDIFTAEEVEADQDAAAQAAPETPVRTEHAAEPADLADEDAIGEEPPSARAESSVRVKGRKPSAMETTDAFDLDEQAADLEQTVAFETADEDDSSAVDLGTKPTGKMGGSSSHAGVDEVAEALESGVMREGVDSPPPPPRPRKPVPSVEFDELVTEEGAAPSRPASAKKNGKETATEPDVDMPEEAAADALEEELGGKSVEDAAADLWNEAGEAEGAGAKAGPSTPIPKKAAAADMPEEGAAAPSDEAAAPRRKRPSGATATMPRPRKPKYGRRWLGGMLLGIILAAVALVGIRYYDPDILDPAYAMLPDAKQPKAVGELKNSKTALANVRDELDKAQSEKADAEKNLEAKTAENKKLTDQVTTLADSEKAVGALRDQLVKKKLVGAKADAGELAKAIAQTLLAKEEKEKLIQQIEKALVEAKQLSDTDKLDAAAIGKVVKDLNDKDAAMAAVNQRLEGAKIKDGGEKGVQQLLTAKKDVDDKLAEVNKFLTAEKIKSEGVAGLKEVVTLRNQLQKDRDELDKAIKDAYKELAAGQFVPPGGDPKQQLAAGAKTARERAESPLAIPLTHLAAKLGSMGLTPAGSTKGAFDVAALLTELNFYRMREPLIQSPEQKLDAYLVIYQDRNRKNPAEDAAALKDAAWVLSKAAKASAAAQAKAHTVIGLVMRNQEKYAESKQALDAAAGAGSAQAKKALQELTDPSAYYLPRVDQLQSGGQYKSAQQELASALKAMPNDARLLAQRGMLQLEESRGKVSDAAQASIRNDANLALKDAKAAADGAYVLGLLEEELGNFEQAEKHLRQALKSHQGGAEEASRYRIALARVLQRDRGPATAPPPAPKKDNKKADATGEGEVSQAFPLAAALLLGQVAPDDDENPAAAARLAESIKLAQELIGSANPKIRGQGHMLLGQALAKQGKRTEGVREYMKGMEMLFPGMASKEMIKLMEEHPAFQQPDAAKAPSPYFAEVQFGKGLQLYFARQYPEAEAHFKQAAGYFSQDARYQYFLGLAQYAQKSNVKRDAAMYSFDQGARLEAANRPPVSEVNASLERIQGDLRKMINEFRSKAIELRN